MNKVKIGLLKEGKIPVDKRVPLTPSQCVHIEEKYTKTQIIAQDSPMRCFPDHSYENEGIEVNKNLLECDILLGVKEVPKNELIENKTYFFFSHTIKKQPYNRELLQEILRKNIRLIDYECLTNENGLRVIAFGRWAGIVGAYNGILTYGQRLKAFNLRKANECYDFEDLKSEYEKVDLPPVKILITGMGRVAKGASEVLEGMGFKKVDPDDYLIKDYYQVVYSMIDSDKYHKKIDGSAFTLQEFFKNPQLFESDFNKYATSTDLLINASFWDPSAPALFSREQMLSDSFRIKVVADISCDIDGPVPCTKKASTIDDPVYDYRAAEDSVETPFSNEGNVNVMAVDNLPCELPINASTDFGNQLIDNVFPYLLGDDPNNIIGRATIAENGHLTSQYEYLQDYVNGK